MKINKNIIKELTEYLDEFKLTEIEYTEKDIKVKVSKSSVTNISRVKEINPKIKSENIIMHQYYYSNIIKNILFKRRIH